ncbi:zinc finger protein 184-like isoform X1 [Diorhabda sublineata]|uniref:zinc finger protein 184-like isoform X1 n=1 Tax=Diorhabda sublineata TaxID=1163346 RepID=UPI0024E0944B|nr:zinc finger protein 184-like isoform X1 [Diorhabda sublineata]
MENVNLNLICRTCKCVSPHMRSLFEGYENPHQSPRIDEMLMACASVQVICGDGLPTLICQICVEQLKNAFLFKKQVEKVDVGLREYAKNLKVNEIKQELQNSEFMESLNTLDSILNEPATKDVSITGETAPPQKFETDYIQFMDNNQMLLTCRECAKMFTTLEGLRCHKRIHTGGMYKCKQCDKEYTRLNHLQRHEQSHNRRKVHVCRICSKTLTRMEHLKRHLVTHLREKPFSCKTCNRGFNRIEHLHNHAPRCKGDTVYPCDICNKAFNREDSLEVHRKMHDSTTPKLPTIENLDNIEDHYYQIDQDPSADFSDHSDVDECFEPQVEVTETTEDNKEKVAAEISNQEEESIHSDGSIGGGDIDNDSDEDEEFDEDRKDIESGEERDNKDVSGVDDECEDQKNVKLEEKPAVDEDEEYIKNVIAEVEGDGSDDDGDSDKESNDSDYVPQKKASPPVKRGRGRPRKSVDSPPKPIKKEGGARRGRKPGSKNKKTLMRERDMVIKEEEDDYGDYPCPVCNEMFNTMSKLDRHAKISHEGAKIHKCNVCSKAFSRINHLKRHITSHSTIKPFRCTACPKSFNRRDHLKQHQKLHERTNDYECEVCQKQFNRADHLAKHKASKHGIGERICVMGEKKYECPLCHKFFTTEKYKDVHVAGHNGTKEYSCKVCEKTFLSKSHLTEHMKFHNEHSKKFLCSECGQRFIRNDYLVIHMRRHRGEKPFKCKYCGKGFPRTTDLTVHERYHTGEKTHLCTICGRGFGRAYNLTVHMRTHTGEKPYQCTYCDAAFAQGNDLKAHVRRHTGERFQCELCTESFLMGYLLTQHKRTVHGLNVVSNIRRLQPVHKQENPDEPPPITIPLPKPVIPDNVMFNALHANALHANALHANALHANALHAQLAVAQLHHLTRE